MQGSKILLVDDDRETRWALGAVLRREGAQVTEAANGEEALRFLVRGRFDLCITDVCMPGLGGFGLYSALRFGDTPDLEWARTLPVMLVSGQVPGRELANALDAGVDDIVEKPCDPEELKARVRATLRRAALMRGPKARTHGDLADFGMGALAQALHLAGRSARLVVQTATVRAVLDFHLGQIRHAQFDDLGGDLRGEEAAIRTLALTEGTFELLPCPDATTRDVFDDTSALMLRAAAFHDADTATIEVAASAAAVEVPAAPPAPEPTGPVSEDAEDLLLDDDDESAEAPASDDETAPLHADAPAEPVAAAPAEPSR